jgi:catechol 2,3-dioxygenase-like lactoylglutathione lyase family enzyme
VSAASVSLVLFFMAQWVPRAQPEPLPTPVFHHLHLNTPDPAAAIAFYVKQFPTTSKATLAGFPALKTGHVYMLFTRVSAPAPTAPQSAYWHFGWHVPSARDYWTRYNETSAPLMPLYMDEGGSVTFSNQWWPGTLTKSAISAAKARGVKSQNGGYGYLKGPDGVKSEFQGDLPAERFNHVHMYQEEAFCAELWYQRHLKARPSGSIGRAEGRSTSETDCRMPLGDPSWLSLEPQGTIRMPAGGVSFGDVDVNWYQRQGQQPLVSSRGQAIDHMALGVGDLDLWLAKQRGEGVKILESMPPHVTDSIGLQVIRAPRHLPVPA